MPRLLRGGERGSVWEWGPAAEHKTGQDRIEDKTDRTDRTDRTEEMIRRAQEQRTGTRHTAGIDTDAS